MQFNTWSEFFAMGGYGYFVWMSFGVTALAMGIETLLLKMQFNRTLADVQTSAPSTGSRSPS
jgi:heme exporter protein D